MSEKNVLQESHFFFMSNIPTPFSKRRSSSSDTVLAFTASSSKQGKRSQMELEAEGSVN